MAYVFYLTILETRKALKKAGLACKARLSSIESLTTSDIIEEGRLRYCLLCCAGGRAADGLDKNRDGKENIVMAPCFSMSLQVTLTYRTARYIIGYGSAYKAESTAAEGCRHGGI